MISVDKAIEIVLKKVKTLSPEKVPLQNAQGLCLAENIKSDIDMPPYNRAAMDGYAVISKNTTKTPIDLVVVENIRAGYNPKKTIRNGQAAKIMTGSVVPKGADAVIKVEETKPSDNDTHVCILKSINKGGNIAKKGEDLRAGKIVLRKGSRIRPAEIGTLATVGADTVQVFRVPRIGIISTGDELIPVEKKPKPWQIRNSNSHSLAAQVRRTITDVEILGIACDQKSKIRSLVQKGLKKDILILSGGVSMGEYDLVGGVLKDLGITILFEKVALRPGKPTVFGKIGDKVIFALPGNPVSTMVTFELFVRPAIKKMMGFKTYHNRIFLAELERDISMKKKRREFRPALLRYVENKWVVVPVDWHGSGDLFSTTKANCLLIIREDVEKHGTGDMVEVMLMDDFS